MRDLLIKVRPVLVKQQQLTIFTLILAAALKPTTEKKSQSNKVQMQQTDPEPPSFLPSLLFPLYFGHHVQISLTFESCETVSQTG